MLTKRLACSNNKFKYDVKAAAGLGENEYMNIICSRSLSKFSHMQILCYKNCLDQHNVFLVTEHKIAFYLADGTMTTGIQSGVHYCHLALQKVCIKNFIRSFLWKTLAENTNADTMKGAAQQRVDSWMRKKSLSGLGCNCRHCSGDLSGTISSISSILPGSVLQWLTQCPGDWLQSLFKGTVTSPGYYRFLSISNFFTYSATSLHLEPICEISINPNQLFVLIYSCK